MPQSHSINRHITLASRPVGAPTSANFSLKETAIPSPEKGEILLRTNYLSLDPYMRGRMNAGASYAEPVDISKNPFPSLIIRV